MKFAPLSATLSASLSFILPSTIPTRHSHTLTCKATFCRLILLNLGPRLGFRCGCDCAGRNSAGVKAAVKTEAEDAEEEEEEAVEAEEGIRSENR